jgi:ABC-2 type transport system permease protein
MNSHVIVATAERVLRQLRRDRRSLALVLVVPPALLTLMKYVFEGQPGAFERIGPPLVGMFPLFLMFLITSIAMLRERTTGTLERLMSMPVAKVDLLLGYGLGFAVVATLEAGVTAAAAFGPLGLETQGAVWFVVLLAVANALLGMALGLLVSAFARSEFQAIQFMPAFLMPQLILAGLFGPRDQMAPVLEVVSNVLPVTYAYQALAKVTRQGMDAPDLGWDVLVIAASILFALILAAATLRRRTP